jgi:hypothetical protein
MTVVTVMANRPKAISLRAVVVPTATRSHQSLSVVR